MMNDHNINQLLIIAEHSLRNNNYDFSESVLLQTLQIDSKNSKANELLAYINGRKGNAELAYKLLISACQNSNCSASALYELGSIHLESGRPEEASDCFIRSLEKAGDFFEALHDLGTAQAQLDKLNESLSSYTKALAIRNDVPQLFFNLGRLYDELKRFDLALDNYNLAIELQPNFADAWRNKGTTLCELKRFDEALICYEKSHSLEPNISFVPGDILYIKMKRGEWAEIEGYKKEFLEKVKSGKKVTSPFTLLALTDDIALQKKCAEIYIQNKYPLNSFLGPIVKHSRQGKIRIAYFSADFGDHPVSYLTAELFELHDRNKFEIFAFSYGADDKGPMRSRLNQAFNQFIDVRHMPDKSVAQLSRDLGIDIAVDFGGFTGQSRMGIFAHRAAPLQVNYLGYAGTMGADYFDYIIADSVVIPSSSQAFYTEKVAYLPNTYMVDDSKRIPSNKVFSRQDFGLSKDAFVFCCFNNDYKFNKSTLESWSRVLLKVKNSVLWVPENNEHFNLNLRTEFERLGIDPSRIVFSQRVELMADHLARYALADLFLDTHPYNAHTTALDSLKAGLPVLTLIGEAFAGRVAASLLNAIGLNELITYSQEEYESLAIELATHPEILSGIKDRLKTNLITKPLFNTVLYVNHIESAYLQMMERYWADLPSDHIHVIATLEGYL